MHLKSIGNKGLNRPSFGMNIESSKYLNIAMGNVAGDGVLPYKGAGEALVKIGALQSDWKFFVAKDGDIYRACLGAKNDAVKMILASTENTSIESLIVTAHKNLLIALESLRILVNQLKK